MPVIEAEKNARYANWLNILSKCAKCQSKEDVYLHYKDGVRCTAQSPWNWKVSTQNEKLVGLCKVCRPTKEESEARKAQHLAVGPKPTPIPSVYDEEGAKLSWFNNAVIKLGHEILEVFGEPITVVDMLARLKASKDTLRQWRDKQSQGAVRQ